MSTKLATVSLAVIGAFASFSILKTDQVVLFSFPTYVVKPNPTQTSTPRSSTRSNDFQPYNNDFQFYKKSSAGSTNYSAGYTDYAGRSSYTFTPGSGYTYTPGFSSTYTPGYDSTYSPKRAK